ncbi:peptidoglycan-binding protein [Rhodobacterales bacterium HKCCE3408]|nr:peptidoglycan-binding protein [Rhodobacterales bacterium HKCCE3408]
MFGKFITAVLAVGALALAPTTRAEADAGDFIGGAIVGGLVTGAIICSNRPGGCNNGNRTAGTTRTVRPGIPATQQGRETQVALNYFGYNAGAVDGQIGNGTRAAIERFQASMGYPVNGREFASYQFDYLMDAYYWAVNGGQQATGMTGQPLLMAYRTSQQQAPAQAFTAPAAPPPATTVIVANPATETPPAGTVTASTGGLPNLFAGGGQTESLGSRCDSVMLQTTTNGGYTTLATMSDPAFTLQEQFCVARTYAIADGERLMQGITGLTQAQVAEQCVAFRDMLGTQADAVSLLGQAEVTADMREFALTTGMPPADLAATSKVCLAVGYRQNDMRMAIGSALMLAAMGESAYGELLGHHLMAGFGTTNRRDLAVQWYDAALSAIESGAAPVFMPGQPERIQLLRQATLRLTSDQTMPAPIPASGNTGSSASLPTFRVNQ